MPSGARRRALIAALVLIHGAAVLGLLAPAPQHEAATEARPVFLTVLDAPPAVAPTRALPRPPGVQAPTPPLLPLPALATPAPEAPAPLAAAPVAAPAPVADATPSAAPPAPAAPRNLPATAVQFLVPPAPVYSRLSTRLRESGRVVVRVLIDDAGRPRTVQVLSSSGFARLDEAAVAAVRNARFKPYLENGVAVEGWASFPIDFELPA